MRNLQFLTECQKFKMTCKSYIIRNMRDVERSRNVNFIRDDAMLALNYVGINCLTFLQNKIVFIFTENEFVPLMSNLKNRLRYILEGDEDVILNCKLYITKKCRLDSPDLRPEVSASKNLIFHENGVYSDPSVVITNCINVRNPELTQKDRFNLIDRLEKKYYKQLEKHREVVGFDIKFTDRININSIQQIEKSFSCGIGDLDDEKTDYGVSESNDGFILYYNG